MILTDGKTDKVLVLVLHSRDAIADGFFGIGHDRSDKLAEALKLGSLILGYGVEIDIYHGHSYSLANIALRADH